MDLGGNVRDHRRVGGAEGGNVFGTRSVGVAMYFLIEEEARGQCLPHSLPERRARLHQRFGKERPTYKRKSLCRFTVRIHPPR